MREYRLIDADCHVVEPPHIWTTWLQKKFQDRAPKLVKDDEGGDAWQLVPGQPPMYIGLVATAGMSFEKIKWKGYTYDTIRKGCWDGKARIADMDFDGVDAQFIYPSQRTMYSFMGNEDREFHKAGVQAYNDFMAKDFCAADAERLFFLGQMPNLGVDEGIAEMKRCREMGARGVIITTWPAGGDDLGPEDDKFFAGAVDMGMPVSIHTRIQRKRNPPIKLEGPAAIGTMALAGMLSYPPLLAELITSGLFDRFPKLNMLGVEVEVGWIPTALEQLDNFYWRNRTHTKVNLRYLPSDYFHRNFVCTFITDQVGIENRYRIGVENMAWSTDYPHHGCDWPYSRKVVAEHMDKIPADERHAICAGNMMRVYRMGTK